MDEKDKILTEILQSQIEEVKELSKALFMRDTMIMEEMVPVQKAFESLSDKLNSLTEIVQDHIKSSREAYYKTEEERRKEFKIFTDRLELIDRRIFQDDVIWNKIKQFFNWIGKQWKSLLILTIAIIGAKWEDGYKYLKAIIKYIFN